MHRLAVPVLLLALAPAALRAQTDAAPQMPWPDATELLTRERLTAEACTRVIKKLTPADDVTALAEAQRDYEAARSIMNGLIVNLQVALIEGDDDLGRETVAARVEDGTTARRAYCAVAEDLMPGDADGEKGVIGEIIGGAVEAVIEAAVTIWSKKGDEQTLRRQGIRDALEMTKWPEFSSIEP